MKACIRTVAAILCTLCLLCCAVMVRASAFGSSGSAGQTAAAAGASGSTPAAAYEPENGTVQSASTLQLASSAVSSAAGASEAASLKAGPVLTASGWVYRKNGRTDTSFSGLARTSQGWLYFSKGVYAPLYCGIVSNGNGLWYVKNGTIAWDYTGLAYGRQKQWYVRYGQVDEDYTGMLYDDDIWYFITDGVATWHYTGSAEQLQYGTSESGRPLTVYRFGTGKNVLLLTYAIHGYEDGYAADGECLVYAAFKLMRELDENMDLITSGSWRVYIVPCANPDGLLDGTSANGSGRLTTGASTQNGKKYTRGIDLNRSFPYLWQRYTESRNYNGSSSLASSEARALYKLTKYIQGKNTNLCIDVHGWYSQIVATGENSQLYKILHAGFPGNEYAGLIGCPGYFSAWAYSIGYSACLFEFPWGTTSFAGFRSSGYTERFNACILNILKYYGK